MKRPLEGLDKLAEEDAGKGLSGKIGDNAFWLNDIDRNDEPWLDALQAIDQRNDNKPLLDLLRSDRPLSKRSRFFLADLIERYQFKKRRGRPPTPAYDLTDAEVRLEQAVNDVHERRKGVPVEKAQAEAAERYAVNLETLAAAYNGRLGSARRSKKRRGSSS